MNAVIRIKRKIDAINYDTDGPNKLITIYDHHKLWSDELSDSRRVINYCYLLESAFFKSGRCSSFQFRVYGSLGMRNFKTLFVLLIHGRAMTNGAVSSKTDNFRGHYKCITLGDIIPVPDPKQSLQKICVFPIFPHRRADIIPQQQTPWSPYYMSSITSVYHALENSSL